VWDEVHESVKYVLFEYACHAGNYYMRNALNGARAPDAKK
jgi:hypothetical protein